MFVVTLPQSAKKNPKVFALKAKRAGADILEIRSDLTPNIKPFTSALPLLVAIRGKQTNLITRLQPAFIDSGFRHPSPFSHSRNSDAASELRGKGKLILSFHDYKKTPSLHSLRSLVTLMLKQKFWAIKIATQIIDYRDLKILMDLQEFLKKKKIRSIVLGMGPKAHLSRILSPYRNTLTYASLDGFESSASGQLPLSFYKLTSGRRKPKIFGIIGGPYVAASWSPFIHNALFQRHKVDALYSCFPTDDFRKTIAILSELGFVGGSVTAPFKRDAFLIAKRRDKISKTLRVSNTLRKTRIGWKAWNTDTEGIEKGYPVLRSARTIAILGAGGAVPSVIRAAKKKNPKVKITVFARDVTKAKRTLVETSRAFSGKSGTSLQIENLSSASQYSADIVICAVSEDIRLPIPKPTGMKIAIDLRYGVTTRFLFDAKKKGFRTYDGMAMLIHQALRQFKHFTEKNSSDDDSKILYFLFRPTAGRTPAL